MQTGQIAKIIMPAGVCRILLCHFSTNRFLFDSITFRGKYLQIRAKIWSEYQPLWGQGYYCNATKAEKQSQEVPSSSPDTHVSHMRVFSPHFTCPSL